MNHKPLSKPKKQNVKKAFYIRREQKIKDRIIKDIWILFETEEEKEEKPRLIKDKKNWRYQDIF